MHSLYIVGTIEELHYRANGIRAFYICTFSVLVGKTFFLKLFSEGACTTIVDSLIYNQVNVGT